MSEGAPEVRVGQVWRRKRDGKETVIVSASMGTGSRPVIRHRIGRRMWDTDRAAFIEGHELNGEAPEIKRGQVWKRNHDGRLVAVGNVATWPENDPVIEWEGIGKRGRGSLFASVFRGRYQLHEEAPDV